MVDQKMNYDEVEATAQLFSQCAQQLNETMMTIQGIASTLDGNGLVGAAGNEMVDALQSDLNPSIQRLADKFEEVQQDLRAAVVYMRDGVDTSRSRFL